MSTTLLESKPSSRTSPDLYIDDKPLQIEGKAWFLKQGSAADYFPDNVRNVLNDYDAVPQIHTPLQELIVLGRMNLGLIFEKPGIADYQGVYRIADQLRRIASDDTFEYSSELGRRFARYCVRADAVAYSVPDDNYNKPLVTCDGDDGGIMLRSPYGSDNERYGFPTLLQGAEDDEQAAFNSLLNSHSFQSFLVSECEYAVSDFGDNFPLSRFVDFISTRSPMECDRAFNIMKATPKTARPELAEAFMATEFGSHLGESILSIAEKDSDGELSTEIFSVINSVRHHLRNWESQAWFAQEGSGYQEYFAGMKRAIEMRISQILSPLPDLIDGTPQMAEYFHRDGSHAETHVISSVDQVIQGLKLLELWTRKNAETEAQPARERRAMFGDDFSAARSVSDGLDVRRMMRPRGSVAGEARIRFTAAVTPEEQLAIFGRYIDVKKNGEPRGSKVSLRLDLEAISSRLSLDLGTRMQYGVGGEREYADRLLAHLMTAGVQHEARNQGKDIIHVDYHVRDTFAPELSEPDVFAGFVEAMQAHYIDPVATELARRAGKLEQLGTSVERPDSSVVYTGLFLDEESTDRLEDLLPPKYVNMPRNPHVTIQFHPKMGIKGFEVGQDSTLLVTGYVDDGKAQVLIVDSDAAREVSSPHITVSTANNEQGKPIPPSYGGHAARTGEMIKFPEPIRVHATSGYLDGRTGKIVVHS